MPDGGCGTFVDSEWLSLAPNSGSQTFFVDFPSNATHVVPFLAVHTTTEHNTDDQCDWETETTQLSSSVRFDINLEHCGTGWYSNTLGFEAQAVVVAQVGSPVTSTSFDLATDVTLPGDHTLSGSGGWTGGGSQRVAICSMMTADGEGDVDTSWACTAEVSGTTLSGSAYENYGNGDTWVNARVAGLGFASNADVELRSFSCSPTSTVTVSHSASTGAGFDHHAFVLPTTWDTGTGDHASMGSTCTWNGSTHSCTISCQGGDLIAGKILFIDGVLGWNQ